MKSVKSDIWEIWKIALSAREHFHYAWYFYSKRTKEEEAYIAGSKHFLFLRESIFKVCIIELCKLVNKSKHDQFNLYTFFDCLGSDIYGKHNINVKIIDKWRISLNGHRKIIESIKQIRKKAYAHTDKEFDIRKENITFKEVRELIETIEVVIRDVYRIENDSDIQIEAPYFNSSPFDIIRILANASKT